jgi:hypothetical protein
MVGGGFEPAAKRIAEAALPNRKQWPDAVVAKLARQAGALRHRLLAAVEAVPGDDGQLRLFLFPEEVQRLVDTGPWKRFPRIDDFNKRASWFAEVSQHNGCAKDAGFVP